MNPLKKLLAVVLFFASHDAVADWTDPGAAYLCDVQANVFSIKSVMDTSSPEDAGTVPLRPLYEPITETRDVTCTFDGVRLHARIEVRPPQATGTCGGFTHTSVRSFKVNGKELYPEPKSFNSACFTAPELYEIDLRKKDGAIQFTKCDATWDWGVGYTQGKCDVEQL